MQSLMVLDCFVQKLSKKNLWGSTRPQLMRSDKTIPAVVADYGNKLYILGEKSVVTTSLFAHS